MKGMTSLIFLYSMLWLAWLEDCLNHSLHTIVYLVSLRQGLWSNSSLWLCNFNHNITSDSIGEYTLVLLKSPLLLAILVFCCFHCVLCCSTTSYGFMLVPWLPIWLDIIQFCVLKLYCNADSKLIIEHSTSRTRISHC